MFCQPLHQLRALGVAVQLVAAGQLRTERLQVHIQLIKSLLQLQQPQRALDVTVTMETWLLKEGDSKLRQSRHYMTFLTVATEVYLTVGQVCVTLTFYRT